MPYCPCCGYQSGEITRPGYFHDLTPKQQKTLNKIKTGKEDFTAEEIADLFLYHEPGVYDNAHHVWSGLVGYITVRAAQADSSFLEVARDLVYVFENDKNRIDYIAQSFNEDMNARSELIEIQKRTKNR